MDQKLPEENIKGRENSWYSTVAKFLLKTGQGDQRLSWNIFFFCSHSGTPETANKVYLESEGGASS